MAAMLMLLALSGCTSPSSSPPPPPLDAPLVREARFEPGSFPTGHDWMVVEVVTDGDLPTLAFNGDWVDHEADAVGPPTYLTSPYRTPCMVLRAVSATESLGFTGIKPRIHQGAELRGPGVEEDVVVSNAHTSQDLGFEFPLRGTGTAYYLFGLNILNQPWPEDALEWSLNATEPFAWNVVASGRMTCGTEPADFEGGAYARLGATLAASTTVAQDLHQSFTFQGAGLLFVSAQADQDLANEVRREGQAVWSQSATGGPVPEPTRSWWVGTPSTWEYWIHSFTDTSGMGSMGYLAIDGLPAALAEQATLHQAEPKPPAT